MKKVITLLPILLLTACNPSPPKNVTDDYKLPPELSHCKIYKVSNGNKTIDVVYCKGAASVSSNTKVGKVASNVAVIGQTISIEENSDCGFSQPSNNRYYKNCRQAISEDGNITTQCQTQ